MSISYYKRKTYSFDNKTDATNYLKKALRRIRRRKSVDVEKIDNLSLFSETMIDIKHRKTYKSQLNTLRSLHKKLPTWLMDDFHNIVAVKYPGYLQLPIRSAIVQAYDIVHETYPDIEYVVLDKSIRDIVNNSLWYDPKCLHMHIDQKYDNEIYNKLYVPTRRVIMSEPRIVYTTQRIKRLDRKPIRKYRRHITDKRINNDALRLKHLTCKCYPPLECESWGKKQFINVFVMEYKPYDKTTSVISRVFDEPIHSYTPRYIKRPAEYFKPAVLNPTVTKQLSIEETLDEIQSACLIDHNLPQRKKFDPFSYTPTRAHAGWTESRIIFE